MKIRIEMTAEELAKGAEFAASVIPGVSASDCIPAEHQQVEVKCNAFELNNVTDPETGVVSELEIKTHFIVWVLRKMKPFIAAFISLWHMFVDFFEDIELMMGDVTILNNGEDLNEKLSKMAEESDYFDDNDDEATSTDPVQKIDMEAIYTVYYKGSTLGEINSYTRHFFMTDDEAQDFITSDLTDKHYSIINVLLCQKSKDIDEMLDGTFFEYRGSYIKKDTDNSYLIITNNQVVNKAINLNGALSYIDFRLDYQRLMWRVFTTDHDHKDINLFFEHEEKAKQYCMETAAKYNTKFTNFYVPADFDIYNTTPAFILYRGCTIAVNNDGSATANIGRENFYCATLCEAMDKVDDFIGEK